MRPIYIIFQGTSRTFNLALLKFIQALKDEGFDDVKATYKQCTPIEFEFHIDDLTVKQHILINQIFFKLINNNSLKVISWVA